jgi:hypothetical protein
MERKPPGANTEEVTVSVEVIAKLLGTTIEEMRDRPEVVKAKLAAIFGELARLGASGASQPQLDATCELMSQIRQELQASGEKVPDELNELPIRLAELAGRFRDASPGELADLLREIASLVGAPGGEGAQLDEVAAWLETVVAPLVGLDREKQEHDERMQAEYREAAKRSIAASLRKHGIQPLTTEPEPTTPGAKMNRHHLFWKEFTGAAAEIKALLTSGASEAAERRVADLLDAFDLNLPINLSLDDEVAVLTFPAPDDAKATVQLQTVIRDSPKLPGWRIVRGRRYSSSRPA